MIRTSAMLLRMAQEFFRTDLVGLYTWDRDARIAPQDRRPEIPSAVDRATRRRMMEEREGKGKFEEKERVRFGPWEILIYSAQEKGPLGEVQLRTTAADPTMTDLVLSGPLDPATWAKIGEHIRLSHQRKAS